MKKTYKILYLEDDLKDVELITEALERDYLPCDVTCVNGLRAFESALAGGWSYDLIFGDFALPDIQGEEALLMAKSHWKDVPFIFISGTMGEEKAVECLRKGATDYVLKQNLSRLAPVVRRALEEARETAARRDAEAATSRVVALLRATLESTSEGILVTDLAGKITTYNRKFMSLCGIPDYVMAPMEVERVLQFLVDQFQDPEAFLAEARLLAAQPERESFGKLRLPGERVLEESSRPHRLGQQTVGRVYTVRDVTAQEQRASHLKAEISSSQRLQAATSAVGIVPWCLTEDSLLLAEFAETLLALEPGAGPRNLAELEALIHPEELDRFHEALEHPRSGTFDLRMRKGDSWIWTRWTLARDPAAGYHGIFMDISEGRRAEEACSEQRRSQGMATLAANLSRTAGKFLRKAQAGLDRARRPEPAQEGPELPLQTTADALERMGALLLQLNAAVSCTPVTSPAVNLPEWLEAFGSQAATTLGAGITLKLQVGPDLPALAMSAAHLQALLLNLCLNARDALQGAGAIQLRVEAERDRNTATGRLRLEVQDQGPGIPLCVQSRMYDLFFTTRGDAFGLGLAVVRTIVEAYQGSIQVESTPDTGTTWRILLPFQSLEGPAR